MDAPDNPGRGRPTVYTSEFAETICTRVSAGETLREICREIGLGESTVRSWVFSDVHGFAARYAKAREMQLEAWSDDIVAVAEDSSRDTITKVGRNGEQYQSPDHEWINRSRLIVDTKKWLMSKLAPKKYGERTQLEHSGPDGTPLVIKWADGSTPKEGK